MARTTGDGTVGKALEVLDLVAAEGRPLRFSELSARAPFPKATLYRLVQTLANQGMLAHDAERQTYAPGLRLVRLAHAAWAQSSLAPLARAHLDTLARDTDETVHLAQLDAGQVLYVDKRTPSAPVDMYSSAGKVGPAYCTGVGKAMLAFTPEPRLSALISQQSFHGFTPATLTTEAALRDELRSIRDAGHAYDREEHEPGIICIAFPILDTARTAIGAISVTSTTDRRDLSALAALAPHVQETATAIARAARDWSFPAARPEPCQTEGAR